MKQFTLTCALLVASLFVFASPSQAQASDVGFRISTGNGRSGFSLSVGSGHRGHYNHGQRGYLRQPSQHRRGDYRGRPSYQYPQYQYHQPGHDYRYYQQQPRYRTVYVQVPVYDYRQVWDSYRRCYVTRYVIVGYRYAQRTVRCD